jgi:hypothetical protein
VPGLFKLSLSFHISPQKSCLHFFPPPYVPHVPPISFSSGTHSEQWHHTSSFLVLCMTSWENIVTYIMLCNQV